MKQRRISVKLVEWGFFHPEVAVEDRSRHPGGHLHPSGHGIKRSVQFFRVEVEANQSDRAHAFVIVQPDGLLEREVIRSLVAAQYPSAGCVFFVQYREGHVVIDHELKGETIEVAAAVATVRYAAGWDESPTIVVECREGRHDVTLSVDDSRRLWAVVQPAL
ncbi:MAG: hypothetical protein ABW133_13890 [Polyangiaceae bacterium]